MSSCWSRSRCKGNRSCGCRRCCRSGSKRGCWSWCRSMSSGRCRSRSKCCCWCWSWRRSRCRRWHSGRKLKSIDLVIGSEVNPTASNNARVPSPSAGHQFVSAAACVNDRAGICVVAVQTLVAFSTSYPYNHVTGAICRGDPSRAWAVLEVHVPSKDYGRRICRSNFVGRNRGVFGMKNKICSLTGTVGGSRLTSDSS